VIAATVEYRQDEQWFLIGKRMRLAIPEFKIAEALRLGQVGRDPGREKKQEPESLRKSLEEFYRNATVPAGGASGHLSQVEI
jgi:hypothetical protein